MARNRYIKTNSNYVLQELHQTTNNGNIYERNWYTIGDLNVLPTGNTSAYSLDNFKVIPNNTNDSTKEYQHGIWEKNDGDVFWTIENLGDDKVSLSTPDEIKLKPNFSSLLDFAYYGSAEKLIEGSIRNIILNFPGEIYLTDTAVKINGQYFYYADNPFEIDFDSFALEEHGMKNDLRIFSKSYYNYMFYSPEGTKENVTWEKKIINSNTCAQNGELLSIINLSDSLSLYVIKMNDKPTLFHDGLFIGGSIRPNDNIVEEFFNSLDDFSQQLLNRKTNYSITLDTPEETEKGFFISKKKYTWPLGSGGWNIDIVNSQYIEYIDSLLNIAEFYDSYYSNNLWRSMTHEAIGNFDQTFRKLNENDIDTNELDNNSRMKAFIHAAGRLFDDIKRYIDGISFINNISYNDANTCPDYFLKNNLTNNGWNIKSPIESHFKVKTSSLYDSYSEGYTAQEANIEFYKRLLINTNAILSAKGTKRGIEMMLSMFGYKSLNFVQHSLHDVERDGRIVPLSWDELTEDEQQEVFRNVYDISEYVYVTAADSAGFKTSTVNAVKELNRQRLMFNEYEEDEYQGLPLKEVIVTSEIPKYGSGIYNEITVGTDIITNHYLIPWFDKTKFENEELYFESKGGWGFRNSKTQEIGDYGKKTITTTANFNIFDETSKHIIYVRTIPELLNYTILRRNQIVYVYDISKANDYNWDLNSDESKPTMSHFFILKDEEYRKTLGVAVNSRWDMEDTDGNVIRGMQPLTYENGEKIYGWKNVSEEELKEGQSEDALRILYNESIIEDNLGNNPHLGNGIYDNGETYKTALEEVFKIAKENDEFIDVDDEILINEEEININSKIFTLNKEIDNVKCWYFTDFTEESRLYKLEKNDDGTYSVFGRETSSVGDTYGMVRDYTHRGVDGVDTSNMSEVEKMFYNDSYKLMTPYNMETNGEENNDDEASANSIVNTKSLYIEFKADYKAPLDMSEFIFNIVMHYAKQVIPSTTLLKYKVPTTGWLTLPSAKATIQSII